MVVRQILVGNPVEHLSPSLPRNGLWFFPLPALHPYSVIINWITMTTDATNNVFLLGQVMVKRVQVDD